MCDYPWWHRSVNAVYVNTAVCEYRYVWIPFVWTPYRSVIYHCMWIPFMWIPLYVNTALCEDRSWDTFACEYRFARVPLMWISLFVNTVVWIPFVWISLWLSNRCKPQFGSVARLKILWEMKRERAIYGEIKRDCAYSLCVRIPFVWIPLIWIPFSMNTVAFWIPFVWITCRLLFQFLKIYPKRNIS